MLSRETDTEQGHCLQGCSVAENIIIVIVINIVSKQV
jgi:hypothetical protein